ncbi:hypothetical protein BH11BAC4_BH11BAC4_15050 [soil metagenome]
MQLLAFEFKFEYVQVAVTILFFVIIMLLLFEFRSMKDNIRDRLGINNDGLKLQLEALERLTLYTERAGLKNLVSRISSTGMYAAGVHAEMVEALKSEYDYNITQQIYVSAAVWSAVTRLKDQNIYILNQLAATLPADAMGIDLSKRILEYSMTKDAELNKIVLDALQFEAKELLKSS